jgi:hypothetical protein
VSPDYSGGEEKLSPIVDDSHVGSDHLQESVDLEDDRFRDCVVAAIGLSGPIVDLDLVQYQKLVDVNVRGPLAFA